MTGAAVSGQCLCGAFRFSVTGPLDNVRLCHCDFCRRGNGSAYSANCRVPLERFSVVHDEGTLRDFENSPGARRYFCGTCGSPVFARVDGDPGHIRVRLGALDRETEATIVAHVWVGSQARWDGIADDLPQFAQGALPDIAASSPLPTGLFTPTRGRQAAAGTAAVSEGAPTTIEIVPSGAISTR